MSTLLGRAFRKASTPGPTWIWIFDVGLAIADAWLARRERR